MTAISSPTPTPRSGRPPWRSGFRPARGGGPGPSSPWAARAGCGGPGVRSSASNSSAPSRAPGHLQAALRGANSRRVLDRAHQRRSALRWKPSSETVIRDGVAPATSRLLWSMVPRNESTSPEKAMTTATIVPTPSAVSRVRRGARSTLRIGICTRADPGTCNRLPSPGEAARACRAEADPDRLDRRHPDAPPDRYRGRHDREDQAQQGAPDEDVQLERRAHHGQRQQVLEGAAEHLAGKQAQCQPEDGPGDGDLGAQQQRADRELPRRHAERHARRRSRGVAPRRSGWPG